MAQVREAPVNSEYELIPICADLDEDCPGVSDHLACWMYDMGRGRCPYCSSDKSETVKP